MRDTFNPLTTDCAGADSPVPNIFLSVTMRTSCPASRTARLSPSTADSIPPVDGGYWRVICRIFMRSVSRLRLPQGPQCAPEGRPRQPHRGEDRDIHVAGFPVAKHFCT